MTTQQVIAYYSNLLIAQYQKGRASQTVQALAGEVVAEQLASRIRDGFNMQVEIGAAPNPPVGKQIDTLASYRDLQRLIYGTDLTRSYFTMPAYGAVGADTAPGFPHYGDGSITDYFFSYEGANAPLYALTDSELYRLTQLRARSQSRLLSVKEVDDILYEFFGPYVGLFEDGGMQVTYVDLSGDPDTLFKACEATKSLPRPAGVHLVTFVSLSYQQFGFQNYGITLDPEFLGFSVYGTPEEGSFLRYS